eukprot:UN2203
MPFAQWAEKGMDKLVLDAVRDADNKLFKIELGEQDVLNYIGHHHPELLGTLQPEANVRADTASLIAETPRVIHGNRGIFQGAWKSLSDRILQAADCILGPGPPESCTEAEQPYCLLDLADFKAAVTLAELQSANNTYSHIRSN